MSPVAEEDRVEVGVLGVEAVHEWVHGLSMFGPLRLNDETAWPRYRVREIGGLGSGAERESASFPRVGKIGTIGTPGKIAGKTVSYTGTVYGRTLAEVRLGRLMLLTAMSVQSPKTMRVIPHADYAGGTEHVYAAVPISPVCDDVQSRAPTAQPTAFGRDFVIALRMDDPRTYRPVPVEVSGLDVNIVAGWAPSDFIAELTGVEDEIEITGEYGTLRITNLEPGVDVLIDTSTGHIFQGGEAAGIIAGDSTLLDQPASLPAGESELSVTGAATMTVTFRRAFW